MRLSIPRRRSRRLLLVGAGALVVVLVIVVVLVRPGAQRPPTSRLPLRAAGEVALPGDNSRFDYASLDAARGLMFLAHLGASEVIEVDVHTQRVVRTIPNLPDVHGVLVVPALHRVYATATGANQMVALDEDTGQPITRAATGDYPDGMAYDPRRGAVWTTNETGGSETVIDAANGTVRGTVVLGGEAGNVAYDPVTDRMLVAVQGRDQVAVIDPASLAVQRWLGLPGCDHDHGLVLDAADRMAFVACDGNATLLTVNLTTGRVTGTNPVGADPDVLAFDPGTGWLYVAAESGDVAVLGWREHRLSGLGLGHLADGAHVVALDPGTHDSYFPVPAGVDGRPTLLERAPVQ